MAITTTVTTTATTKLVIEPKLKQRLKLDLVAYAELKALRDEIDEKLTERHMAIERCRGAIGEDTLAIDGFKVTRIYGTYESLNKKKLVELGCAMAWIEEATERRPKKAYNKISCPGDRHHDSDSDD